MDSLLALVVGAVLGGLGQGMALRAALTSVSAAASDERRGATISAFFVVAYAGISLPVVGVGALALAVGLGGGGLGFAGCVVALTSVSAAAPDEPRGATISAFLSSPTPESPCRWSGSELSPWQWGCAAPGLALQVAWSR